MKKILSVIGARPNFVKIAPLYRAFNDFNHKKGKKVFDHKICHTGQHYDYTLSQNILNDLELPEPDYFLNVGSGTHAVQTARIIIEFEKVVDEFLPDLVIVVGDVNSTMACTLVAVKKQIKVAHVEAGLRSFDRNMPEEINRIVTDVLADFLFVSEPSGIKNLKHEGIPDEKVYFVGNVMIDSLLMQMDKIKQSSIVNHLALEKNNYILATFHRPSNVDHPEFLEGLMNLLAEFSKKIKIVFPAHPRTFQNLKNLKISTEKLNGVLLIEPVKYTDFIALMMDAKAVLTDSGGLQEESTFLGVPCITVRNNTERPVTVDVGTNILAGTDLNLVKSGLNQILQGRVKNGKIPRYWDGKTAERIVHILSEKL